MSVICCGIKSRSTRPRSYSGIPPVSGDVSLDRAIAQAARDTLVALYPGQQTRLDGIFNIDIANIPGSKAAIDAGAALGTQAANAILALRLNDGSQLPEPTVMATCAPGDDTCFPANTAPGKWQIDPISQLTVALGAHWGKVKPFVMTSADQFRAPVPPSLTSDAYKEAFKEVLRLGGDPEHGTNTSRTERQTFIAKFWSYDGTPGLCAPTREYNIVTRTIALQQRMHKVPEIARLFALVNTALADAGIASWESKYFYQYWRPVTGIRDAVSPLTRDLFTRLAHRRPTPLGVRTSRRHSQPIHRAMEHLAAPYSKSCANSSRTKRHLPLFRTNGTA